METRKVEEALELAKVAIQTELGSNRDKLLLTRVQQQAGFLYLADGKYRQASEMMHQGNVDIREVSCTHMMSSGFKTTFSNSSGTNRGSLYRYTPHWRFKNITLYLHSFCFNPKQNSWSFPRSLLESSQNCCRKILVLNPKCLELRVSDSWWKAIKKRKRKSKYMFWNIW